jgi:hypothetical protein
VGSVCQERWPLNAYECLVHNRDRSRHPSHLIVEDVRAQSILTRACPPKTFNLSIMLVIGPPPLGFSLSGADIIKAISARFLLMSP